MKHKLLFQHLGENSTTSHDPVAEVIAQDGDQVTARRGDKTFTVSLKEQHTCCISWDFDMLTAVDKYRVGEVETPDWMTADEYVSHQTEFKYFVGFGGQLTWPRQWFYRLIKFGEANKFAAIKLLNVQNFRSPFRQSLRSQLEAWLNDPNQKYESPFSRRQWEALLDVYTCRAARNRATSLYWNR